MVTKSNKHAGMINTRNDKQLLNRILKTLNDPNLCL